MTRSLRWVVPLVALAVASFLLAPKLFDGPRTPPESQPERAAPAIPTPTIEQKVAYFYGVLRDGRHGERVRAARGR